MNGGLGERTTTTIRRRQALQQEASQRCLSAQWLRSAFRSVSWCLPPQRCPRGHAPARSSTRGPDPDPDPGHRRRPQVAAAGAVQELGPGSTPIDFTAQRSASRVCTVSAPPGCIVACGCKRPWSKTSSCTGRADGFVNFTSTGSPASASASASASAVGKGERSCVSAPSAGTRR